jgi:phage I-like protein
MLTKTASHLLISCFDAASTAIADAMTSVVTIDVYAAADQATAEAKTAPEWIKLAPRGKFTARDGRSFDADPEVLVQRFDADGVAVPVDVDHATVKKAMFGDVAPAVGWIEKLEARADGLYGQVAWLDEGVRVLAARTHRYVSPALKADDFGKAIWLHSAGLVAAPAISMPAVASAQPKTEPTMLKAIAAALGLTEDAAEASCLSAITTLRGRIDPAVHQQTLDTLSAVQTELDGIKKADRKKTVDALLEGALTAKKISPAQRESYEALCATDDGLAQVTKLIETLGAGLAPTALDTKRAPGDVSTLSAEDRDVMKMLGQTEEEFRKANNLTAA